MQDSALASVPAADPSQAQPDAPRAVSTSSPLERRRELKAVLTVALALVEQTNNRSLSLSIDSYVGALGTTETYDLGSICHTLTYTKSISKEQGRFVILLLYCYAETCKRPWTLPKAETEECGALLGSLDPEVLQALQTALLERTASVLAEPEPAAAAPTSTRPMPQVAPAARPAQVAAPTKVAPSSKKRIAALVSAAVVVALTIVSVYVVRAGIDESPVDAKRFQQVLPVASAKVVHDNQIDLTLTDDKFFSYPNDKQEAAVGEILLILSRPGVESGVLRYKGDGAQAAKAGPSLKIRFFHKQDGRLVMMGPPS